MLFIYRKDSIQLSLTLSYLGESKKQMDKDSIRLLIVRKPPIKIPEGFIHVHQLSPSIELFSQAQEWKQQFECKEDWWGMYEERFLNEMKTRKDLVRALDRLEQRLKEGKNITLYCYCKDVAFCHRRYIGEEMERRGFEVDFRRLVKQEQLSLFD